MTYADRNCFSSGGVCTGLPCTRCGTGTRITRTMRSCIGCGNEIMISPKIAAFAKKHGKDLSRWPSRCASCVLEVIFDSFASIDVEPLVVPVSMQENPPAKKCSGCDSNLGAKFYSDVPDKGDLCLVCHATWRKETT